MGQLNIQMTPDFEKALLRLMRVRGLKTKSEAVRVAVQEGLERALGRSKTADFHAWLGLASRKPLNRSPRFKSEDDLWS